MSSSLAKRPTRLGCCAVAGQDVEPGESEDSWRIARRTAADRVISTVDPDARHVHKSVSSYRDGYKAHIVVEPVTG